MLGQMKKKEILKKLTRRDTSLSHFHLYYQVKFLDASRELHSDYENWSKEVELMMAPIFEGKSPMIEVQNVKC